MARMPVTATLPVAQAQGQREALEQVAVLVQPQRARAVVLALVRRALQRLVVRPASVLALAYRLTRRCTPKRQDQQSAPRREQLRGFSSSSSNLPLF